MAKTKLVVDQTILVQALAKAESKGPLSSLDALWKSACEIYNRQNDIPRPITPSVVMLRAKEWQVAVKTQAGKAVVDQTILVRALTQAEANGALSSLDALWKSACEIYNRQNDIPRPITPSIVSLRAKEWQVAIKTQAGKKGRLTAEHKAAWQAGRQAARRRREDHPQKEEWIAVQQEKLRINGALRLLPLVESAAKGRRKAQDKLFCMECCGYSSKEVRLCSDIGCPKWLTRPFQQAQTDEQIAAEEISEDANEETEDAT